MDLCWCKLIAMLRRARLRQIYGKLRRDSGPCRESDPCEATNVALAAAVVMREEAFLRPEGAPMERCHAGRRFRPSLEPSRWSDVTREEAFVRPGGEPMD